MRAFVHVNNGPLRGTKKGLAKGQAFTFGRHERCDLAFPGDVRMSARHAALLWDGRACRVRDSESLAGTLLGGERVTEADVENGAYLQLGDTSFSVFFEGGIAPRKKHLPSPEMRALREKALSELRGATGPLHAVLDAARDARVLELLSASTEPYASLYEGVAGEALAEVAPYLVRFEPESALLERLVTEGWGDAWGIYLTWPGRTRDLRRHLRRFLMVTDAETRAQMYFRFYDPRVLRDFLPLVTVQQAGDLFGEIGCFLLEGEGGGVRRFERGSVPACT